MKTNTTKKQSEYIQKSVLFPPSLMEEIRVWIEEEEEKSGMRIAWNNAVRALVQYALKCHRAV